MPKIEYKTVALPRSVAARRKRRQSEADLVAEQLGKVLNEEAVDGWEYVRAETLTTPGRKSMFSKGDPAAYIVLIFRRDREAVWRRDEVPEAAPAQRPVTEAVPRAPVKPADPVEPHIGITSTSTQLYSSGETSGTVTTLHPLGSAKD